MGSVKKLSNIVAEQKILIEKLTQRNNFLLSLQRKIQPSATHSNNSTPSTACVSNTENTDRKEPKLPPLFVSGIKYITKFDKLLEETGLSSCVRKTLPNNETKILPSSADDY